jgi:hypothetical protein
MRKCAISSLLALVLAIGSGSAYGQARAEQKPKDTRDTIKKLQDATRNSPLMWDVQIVIDGYVRHMSAHYNLTDNQEQYTRELLGQRVKQFLKDYEKDVRAVMGEYYEYMSRREVPSPATAKEFARRAAPLAAAIRQEIMDGNMQWRRILNEEQIKKHDHDLEQLRRQFDQMDSTLERWSNGDVRPSDVGVRDQQTPRIVTRVEDAMEYYVRNFIAKYSLDEGQKQTALSVLREARAEVARYRESHKDEFASIEAKQKELYASNPKDDPEQLKRVQAEGRKLTEQKSILEKPLSEDLFNRLKSRLDGIPTADQKNAYQARQDALMSRLSKLRTATTLPASTRPAVTEKGTETAPAEANAATP